jgi:hypothetical protein
VLDAAFEGNVNGVGVGERLQGVARGIGAGAGIGLTLERCDEVGVRGDLGYARAQNGE